MDSKKTGVEEKYECPGFDNLWNPEKRPEVPESYYDRAEKDMIHICGEFYQKHPSIAALLIECTGMEPFAGAVQRVGVIGRIYTNIFTSSSSSL